jgi:hypothetical protein
MLGDGVMKRVGHPTTEHFDVTSASLNLDYKIAARNKNGGLLKVFGRKTMSLFGSSAENTVT